MRAHFFAFFSALSFELKLFFEWSCPLTNGKKLSSQFLIHSHVRQRDNRKFCVICTLRICNRRILQKKYQPKRVGKMADIETLTSVSP